MLTRQVLTLYSYNCFETLNFTFTIISTLLSLFYLIYYDLYSLYSNELFSNLSMSPITNIQISKPIFFSYGKYTNNPQFHLGKWEGINAACDCRKISNYKYLYKKNCNDLQLNDNCTDMKSILSVPLDKWKNLIFNMDDSNIKKINYFDILLNNYYSNVSECDVELKKCGILDKKNNILCLPKNYMCPINDIFIDKNEEIIENDRKKFNYQTFELKDGFYLHFTNERINDGKILVEMKIKEISEKCSNKLDDYFLINYSKKYKNFICEENFLDERFFYIDSLNKKTVYEENGILNILPKNYKFFDNEMKIGISNYIGINNNNLDKKFINSFILFKNKNFNQNFEIYVFIFFILSCFRVLIDVTNLFLSFILFVLFCYFNKIKNVQLANNHAFYDFFLISFCVFKIIFTFILMKNNNKILFLYNLIDDNKSYSIKNIRNCINNLNSFDILYLLFSFQCIIFDIIIKFMPNIINQLPNRYFVYYTLNNERRDLNNNNNNSELANININNNNNNSNINNNNNNN